MESYGISKGFWGFDFEELNVLSVKDIYKHLKQPKDPVGTANTLIWKWGEFTSSPLTLQ